MKKFTVLCIALLMMLLLALPCFAQETHGPEIAPTTTDYPANELADAEVTQNAAGVNDADEASIAEMLQDYLLANWDAIAVAGYIIYKILPVIGGIAKSKKEAKAVKDALDTYFGNEESGKNVFAVQKSAAQEQVKFMNDADAVLSAVRNAVIPIENFIEQSKSTEQARNDTAKIAVAVESAVELMANQFNDLVLASPSLNAKKKDEIATAWLDKKKELHELTKALVNENDDKSEV